VQTLSLDPGYGDLLLKPADGTLQCGEKYVSLSTSEMQLLLLLLRKGGETVRRTALEAAAWGLSEAVTPNALDVALHRLRRKLIAIASRQRIVNVKGLGYALREDDTVE
jgi:DNA-binding response OmpR family regulator